TGKILFPHQQSLASKPPNSVRRQNLKKVNLTHQVIIQRKKERQIMPKPSQKRGELDTTPASQTCVEEKGAGSADATSEILKELKLFRTETAGNFGVLRKEVSNIKLNFEELKTRVDDAEQRIADNEDRNMDLTKVLFHLMRKQKYLEEKCEDLEGRSRRNNLRIYSVPEKTEGSNMIVFIEKLIREQLRIREEIFIERAHRVAGTGVPVGRAAADFTRSIIVCFRSFKEKRVLHAAWSLKDIRINDQRIYFDEDYTTEVFKERAKYRSSRVLYPAKLMLFLQDGKSKTFENPREAS
uniref:L1 transposable element RRM domain-containing protein n=1 Tax=Gouania willdenowi TaxID=441366 RepID=A0A8C5G3Z9_GOUWI